MYLTQCFVFPRVAPAGKKTAILNSTGLLFAEVIFLDELKIKFFFFYEKNARVEKRRMEKGKRIRIISHSKEEHHCFVILLSSL